VVEISKYPVTPFFSDTLFWAWNDPKTDTFEIASQNLVLFSSNSGESYVGRYVVKISEYLETPLFFDAILRP